MARLWWKLVAAGVAAILLVGWWRLRGSPLPSSRSSNVSDSASAESILSRAPLPRVVSDPSAEHRWTHVDAQKRAEILSQILALMQADAGSSEGGGDASAVTLGGRRAFRSTNDIELGARFIQERIREDFVPMAQGCYRELLQRKPEAEGDVVVGFEVMGDESVGGVVNSAEIRNESTLRDESLETCLRESFLSVYFDPPPAGAVATIRFPFHFAHGDVDGSHELHLRDRRHE